MTLVSNAHALIAPVTISICAIALLLKVPSAQGSPYVIADDRVRSLDITPQLGRGYSIMTNAFHSTCLDVDETTVPSYNYDYSFSDILETNALETEVSGSLSSLFAYSYIKRQFATSSSVESESDTTTEKHYVISSMRIERYYSSIKEEVSPLTKDARTLLDDQDYIGFFKACGPNYVRSIRRAQEVTAIFSFSSTSRELAQEFARGLKTNTLTQASSKSSAVSTSSTESSLAVKSKFKYLNESLEIKILGYGLGLNHEGSGTLVAASVDEFNDVMKFAFKSMTQGDDTKHIGMVYGLEVVPWVDNAEFQVASHVHQESIEIPLPRSLIAKSYRKTNRSDTKFVSTDRDDFTCKDPENSIDKFGYCCELTSFFDTSSHEYTDEEPNTKICRPLRSLDKSVVTTNMSANAEFVARLDAAVRLKLTQFATLEKCVSAARSIPEQFDYYLLQAQDTAKYDQFLDMRFTLAELKVAIDPFNNYSLVQHFAKELDEFMSMYYSPCVADLFGSNIGQSSDTEADYFKAYPWHTHKTCIRLSCLSESMRWDRNGGGCTPSLITGEHAPGYDGDNLECKYDTELSESPTASPTASPTSTQKTFSSTKSPKSSTTPPAASSSGVHEEVCEYSTLDLEEYHGTVTDCWKNALPSGVRTDYLMKHFCMPVLTGEEVSSERKEELKKLIDSACLST